VTQETFRVSDPRFTVIASLRSLSERIAFTVPGLSTGTVIACVAITVLATCEGGTVTQEIVKNHINHLGAQEIIRRNNRIIF
jgi:F420-0:gamma-glutamyl ligase